jgi:hypothetical protein
MCTHRVSVISFAGALALLLTATTAVSAREYTGERSWSGKSSTQKADMDKRGGPRGDNRDAGTRAYTPKTPVVVDNGHNWRDDGHRGRHHGRYNRWHRFERDGDLYRPRWQRRAWWHRYW